MITNSVALVVLFILSVQGDVPKSSVNFQFVASCIHASEFMLLQEKFIEALSENLGIALSKVSVSHFKDRGLQTTASRRLLTVPASPGLNVEVTVAPLYRSEAIYVESALSESLVTFSIRSVGFGCDALMQSRPVAFLRDDYGHQLTMEEALPQIGSMTSIAINERNLLDGSDLERFSSVWFRLEPSSGNITGGFQVIVHGLNFDRTAANYICKFSTSNQSVTTLPAMPTSSNTISFVLPPWPYQARITKVTLSKVSTLTIQAVPHEGEFDLFEYLPFWIHAYPSRGPAFGGTQITISAVGLSNETGVAYFCRFHNLNSFEISSSDPQPAVWTPDSGVFENFAWFSVRCTSPFWPYHGKHTVLTLHARRAANETIDIDFGGCESEKFQVVPDPELRIMAKKHRQPSLLCDPFIFQYDGDYDPFQTSFAAEIYFGSHTSAKSSTLNRSISSESTIMGYGSAAGGTTISLHATRSHHLASDQFVCRFQEESTQIVTEQSTTQISYSSFSVDTLKVWTSRARLLMSNTSDIPESQHPNLRYWFKPESFQYDGRADGEKLSTWPNSAQIGCTAPGCIGGNQSGNGLPFERAILAQSNSAARPTYGKNVLNGYGVVRFRRQNSTGSAGQYLQLSNFSQQNSPLGIAGTFVNPFTSNGGSWTIFVVCRTQQAVADTGIMGIFQAAAAASPGYAIWKTTRTRLPAAKACQNKSVCYFATDVTTFSSLNGGLGNASSDNSCASKCSRGCRVDDCLVSNSLKGELKSVATIDPDDWRVVTMLSNGTHFKVFIDGAHSSPNPPILLSGSASPTDFKIGCVGPNALTCMNFMSGEVAEILFYDRSLAIDEMDRIGYYLSTKFGLPAFRVDPGSWPYMNSTTHSPVLRSCQDDEVLCATQVNQLAADKFEFSHAVWSHGRAEDTCDDCETTITCTTPSWPWAASTTTITLWKKTSTFSQNLTYALITPKPFGTILFSFTEILTSVYPTTASARGGEPISLLGHGFGTNNYPFQVQYFCLFQAVAICSHPDGSICLDSPQKVNDCDRNDWDSSCLSISNERSISASMVRKRAETAESFLVCLAPTWSGMSFGETFAKISLWKVIANVSKLVDSTNFGVFTFKQHVSGFAGQLCVCSRSCSSDDIVVCPLSMNTTISATGGDVIIISGYGFHIGNPVNKYKVKVWNADFSTWCLNVTVISSQSISCSSPRWNASSQIGFAKTEKSDVKLTVFYDDIVVPQTIMGLRYFEYYTNILPTMVSPAGGTQLTVQGAGFNTRDYAYKCLFSVADLVRQSEPVPAVAHDLIVCKSPFAPLASPIYNFTLQKCVRTVGDFPFRNCSLVATSHQKITIVVESGEWSEVDSKPLWQRIVESFRGFNQLHHPYQYNNLSASVINDMVYLRGVIFSVAPVFLVLTFDTTCPLVCSPDSMNPSYRFPLECVTTPGEPYECKSTSRQCGVCQHKGTLAVQSEYMECMGLNPARCSAERQCIWNAVSACPAHTRICPNLAMNSSPNVQSVCSVNEQVGKNAMQGFVVQVEQGLSIYLGIQPNRVKGVGAMSLNGTTLVKIMITAESSPSPEEIADFLMRVRSCRSSRCPKPGWSAWKRGGNLPIIAIRPFYGLSAVAQVFPAPSMIFDFYLFNVPNTLTTGEKLTAVLDDIYTLMDTLNVPHFNFDSFFYHGGFDEKDCTNRNNASGKTALELRMQQFLALQEKNTLRLQIVVSEPVSWIFDYTSSSGSFTPLHFTNGLKKLISLSSERTRYRLGCVLQYILTDNTTIYPWGALDQEPLIANLESQFKPEARTAVLLPSGGAENVRVDILPDGELLWISAWKSSSTISASWFSLDGVFFRRRPQFVEGALCFQPTFIDVDFPRLARSESWNHADVSSQKYLSSFPNDTDGFSKLQYRRHGNLVQFRGIAFCEADSCSKVSTLFQLPDSYRPYQSFSFSTLGTENRRVRLDVLADGSMIYDGSMYDFHHASCANYSKSLLDLGLQVGMNVKIKDDVAIQYYNQQVEDFEIDSCSPEIDGCMQGRWITENSVGRITRIDDSSGEVWVRFKGHQDWSGKIQQIEPVNSKQWISLDGIAFPITQSILTEGMAVKSATSHPTYGWQQLQSRVTANWTDIGIVTDIGCIPRETLLQYTNGVLNTSFGPDDVLIDFDMHKFWRGVRSELNSFPPLSNKSWRFGVRFSSVPTVDAAVLVSPWISDGGQYCTGGAFSGQLCSTDDDCLGCPNIDALLGRPLCIYHSFAFHTYQNGRIFLFGIIQMPQRSNRQRTFAYLPLSLRPSGKTQVFQTFGAHWTDNNVQSIIRQASVTMSVLINIHADDGRMEIASDPQDIAWISVSGISFTPVSPSP